MKVISFLGSPRVNGNTELLLAEAVKAIEEQGHEVTIFRPARMNIGPCESCGACEGTGECIITDEMDDVYKAIYEGHRFIISTPLYFASLTAQIKTVIDRCQAIWSAKYLLEKPIPEGADGRKGLLLMAGGMKSEKQFQGGELVAKAFFRTINVSSHETLYFKKIDAEGDIKKHPTALKEAYEAGRKLVL